MSDVITHPAFTDQEHYALTAYEAEKSLLGAIFANNKTFKRVSSFLGPEHFADPVHGKIYEAVTTLVRKGRVATPVSLANFFETDALLQEVGGTAYLAELAASAVTIINAEEYGRIVYDLFLKRRVLLIADEIKGDIAASHLATPADEIASGAINRLQELVSRGFKGFKTKREVAEGLVAELARPRESFSTGLEALDKVMGGGMFAGRMYGFAARKKVGKTILLGTVSHNLALACVPHLFIAMETPAAEIEQRNAAREKGFNSVKFLSRDEERVPEWVSEYAVRQGDSALYEDAPSATLDQVRGMIARAVVTRGIKGVVLDYWQLVKGKAPQETEEYHLRTVAQTLADIARKESLFILVAAQVNQDGNTRGGEGLKLACDQYYTLHREKDAFGAWLEMEESRYTMYRNVGTEAVPGLLLDKHGPHFRTPDEEAN